MDWGVIMKFDRNALIMKTSEGYKEEDARCSAYDINTGKCNDTNKGCDCCASFNIDILLDK